MSSLQWFRSASPPSRELRPILQDTDAIVDQFRRRPAAVVDQPNAGVPRIVGDTVVYDADPETLATHRPRVCGCARAVVGGCCGSTPEHIVAASPERSPHSLRYPAAAAQSDVTVVPYPFRSGPRYRSIPLERGTATRQEEPDAPPQHQQDRLHRDLHGDPASAARAHGREHRPRLAGRPAWRHQRIYRDGTPVHAQRDDTDEHRRGRLHDKSDDDLPPSRSAARVSRLVASCTNTSGFGQLRDDLASGRPSPPRFRSLSSCSPVVR